MAHYTKAAGFPNVPLTPGMRIRLRALALTTDATVAGVTVSQFAIFGHDLSGDDFDDTVPLYTPEDVESG